MACGRMRELAFLASDGELTAEESAELAAHLPTCAECRAAAAAAPRIAAGLRELAPPPVPLGFAERIVGRVDGAPPTPRRFTSRPWFLPLGALAASLLGLAVFLLERGRQAAVPPTELAAAPTAVTYGDGDDDRRAAAPAARGLLSDGEVDDRSRAEDRGGAPAGDAGRTGAPIGGGGGGGTGSEGEPTTGKSNEAPARGAPTGRSLDEKPGSPQVPGVPPSGAKNEAGGDGSEKDAKTGHDDAATVEPVRRVPLLGGFADADAESIAGWARGSSTEALRSVARLLDGPAQEIMSGFAKDKDGEAPRGAPAPAAKAKGAAVPELRFAQATGDPAQWKRAAGATLVQDGKGRAIVEMNRADADAFAAKLARAGVKLAPVAAADWLAAARAAAAERAAKEAAKPATEGAPLGKSAPSKSVPERSDVEGAAQTGGKARTDEPRGSAGSAGAAKAAPARVRWIVLFSEK